MLENLSFFIINQTFKGPFEWVIVSDGSTDNTIDVVNKIIDSTNIPIKFICKANGGKHTAWREATKVFEGRYVITCDDDDPISLNMLDIFDKYWSDLEKSPNYDLFWEIRSRAQYVNGDLVGDQLPLPYFDSDYNEVSFIMKKACEMVGCRKVEVLRNEAAVPDYFLFEDKCSNFSEGIRWSRAARKYKTRFIPNITRTYVVGHESLCSSEKGRSRSIKKNYNSLVSSLYSLNEYSDLLKSYDLKKYFLLVLSLAYSSIRVKQPILFYVQNPLDKFFVLISYSIAFIIYLFRK